MVLVCLPTYRRDSSSSSSSSRRRRRKLLLTTLADVATTTMKTYEGSKVIIRHIATCSRLIHHRLHTI